MIQTEDIAMKIDLHKFVSPWNWPLEVEISEGIISLELIKEVDGRTIDLISLFLGVYIYATRRAQHVLNHFWV